jgi:hypothetical protein
MSDNSDVESLPSWHDNLIYGIHWRCAEPDRGLWRSELVLDIDHILDWVPSRERCFTFLMAPAVLVFHDAGDLEISLDCGSNDGYRRYLNIAATSTNSRFTTSTGNRCPTRRAVSAGGSTSTHPQAGGSASRHHASRRFSRPRRVSVASSASRASTARRLLSPRSRRPVRFRIPRMEPGF